MTTVARADLVLHAKVADDACFEAFLPLIRAQASDERNFVKKAVNWSLRQIGKRNQRLNRSAIAEAQALTEINSPLARGTGRNALRELTGGTVQEKLRKSA